MNEQVPYLEDNNRKGATHGEAIFGDKQAQFNVPETTETPLTPTGESEMDFLNQQEASHNVAVNQIGELAAQHAVALTQWVNQHPDASQEQVEEIAKQLNR